MRLPSVTAPERGFTLVEVVMAMTLLLLGVLATVTMVDQANSTTNSTKAREAATGLARELLEAGRAIPYPDLDGTAGTTLEARPGLEDAKTGTSGWQVERRGFYYTVTASVCLIDDISDGVGVHDPPAAFCPTGSASGDTGDRNPDDEKRLTVKLEWTAYPGAPTHSTTQSSVIANPAGALGPTVATLDIKSPTPVLTSPPPPIIGTDSTVSFEATTKSPAESVVWSIDGQPHGSASEVAGSNQQTWRFSWDLDLSGNKCCAFYDGTYTVGAEGFDKTGRSGTPRTLRVRINRHPAIKTEGFAGGYNRPIVDLVWKRNPERDVEGYRVYRLTSTGAEQQVDSCIDSDKLAEAYTTKLECYDEKPQFDSSDQARYVVRGVDRDNSTNPGALRDGDASDVLTVVKDDSNLAPTIPTGLVACGGGDAGCLTPDGQPAAVGTTVLRWIGSVDPLDGVLLYRIYRDGRTFADRYGKVFDNGAGAYTFVDSDTGAAGHDYWVTAVDTRYAESAPTGPVQP